MLFCVNFAYAHRPHDDIRDVGISPAFSKDGTAFIIMHAGMVFKRTTNYGGTWNWLNKGLDYVHRFTSIAVSPAFETDGTVFVSSGADGVYKSDDSGDSWVKINQGIESSDIRRVWISPNYSSDSTVLAADADGKLYRSLDGGKNWESFYVCEKRITSISFFPGTPNQDLIAGDQRGFLHRFIQGSWKKVRPSSDSGAVTAIAVSPFFEKDKTFWVGTENHGILMSVDGGDSFIQANTGLGAQHITSLVAKVRDNSRTSLWATIWNEAIFRSEDGGKLWQKLDHGLTTDPQADAPDFMLPHFKGIAYQDNYFLLGGFDGLFMSEDDGKNWRQLETWPIGNISLIALSPIIGKNRQSAFLAYAGGAYLIPDVRAKAWVNEVKCLTLAGVQGRRTDSGISDVVFSPAYAKDRTIFAATEHELIKTSNSGKTWSRVDIKRPFTLRVRRKLSHYMRKIGISSDIRLMVVGFFPLIPGWSTYVALSPGYENDGTLLFGTQGVGQCLSTDWGKSCSVIFDTALKLTTSMVISPSFSDDRTLFVGVRGEGIYRTEDGGGTFTKSDNGVKTLGSIKLAISPEYYRDHMLLAGTSGGLFITTDGGKKWRPLKENGLPENGAVLHVVISPNFNKDRTVILAIQGRGIFKSTDGGNTFSAIGTDLIEKNEQLKQICFSGLYAQDSSLYGVSAKNVYRSSDGGTSWQLIQRPVRYEDVWDIIMYEGDWEMLTGGQYSDSTLTRSRIHGSKATLKFFGSGIRWISEKSPEGGNAKVYLDGRLIEELSLLDNAYIPSAEVFRFSSLNNGIHEITIEVSGKDLDNGWVALDAFEIFP
jgi:photosystem II stability/assembly factor-like uncharacterized protein